LQRKGSASAEQVTRSPSFDAQRKKRASIAGLDFLDDVIFDILVKRV
jgi:hypothetical protein